MNKGSKKKVLGRKVGPRNALMKLLSRSLIFHKRIVTTLAKAKALRPYVEKKLLKRSVEDTMANRRLAFRALGDKAAIKILFQEIGQAIGQRKGGYTRIIKLAKRTQGDGSRQAMIELVDYNTVYSGQSKKTKVRRRRKKKSGASAAPTTPSAANTTKIESKKKEGRSNAVEKMEKEASSKEQNTTTASSEVAPATDQK